MSELERLEAMLRAQPASSPLSNVGQRPTLWESSFR